MKKGFTLIELLVVIAIIGILSSVVIASTKNGRERIKMRQQAESAVQSGCVMEINDKCVD